MSASGLIYAAIALLWAAVLIPMWLRSHDTSTQNRSAERFGQAMRVLSRKSGAEDEPDVADANALKRRKPSRHKRPEPERDRTVSAEQPTRPRRQVSAPRARPARRSIAQRRARTLFALLGAAAFMGLLAAVGLLPMWAPVPFVVLVVAFTVHLRTQAMRAEAVRRNRREPRAELPSRSRPAEAPRRAAQAANEPAWTRWRTGFAAGPSRAVVVETKAMGATTNVEAESDYEPAVAFEDDEAWRPNPLPLPTYVTAPKAMRPIRVIDLTTPGAWSSGRVLDEDATPDEDLLAAEVAADELDALLEHEAAPAPKPADGDASRRAVGD